MTAAEEGRNEAGWKKHRIKYLGLPSLASRSGRPEGRRQLEQLLLGRTQTCLAQRKLPFKFDLMILHFTKARPTLIIQGRAVTWRRGLVNNYLRVPIACPGRRTAAEQMLNSQKIVYKTSTQSNSPAWYSCLDIANQEALERKKRCKDILGRFFANRRSPVLLHPQPQRPIFSSPSSSSSSRRSPRRSWSRSAAFFLLCHLRGVHSLRKAGRIPAWQAEPRTTKPSHSQTYLTTKTGTQCRQAAR